MMIRSKFNMLLFASFLTTLASLGWFTSLELSEAALEALGEHDAERVDVDLVVVGLVAEDLGRRPAGRAHLPRHLGDVLLEEAREAEVGDLGGARRRQQDVRRLEVAVDDGHRKAVQERHALGCVDGDLQHELPIEWFQGER